MRLLFLNPIGNLGGAERSLLDLFAALQALEPTWEYRLIVGTNGPLIAEAEKLGIRTELLALPDELLVLDNSAGKDVARSSLTLALRMLRGSLGATNYAAKLRTRIDAFKPDLVHSNGTRFHLITKLLGALRAPVVWHMRDFINTRKLMRRALRWSAGAATVAIANSNAVALDARKVLDRVPVRVVLNCVDTQRFTPGKPNLSLWSDNERHVASESEIFRVGMLASYARWKGQDFFLKIVAGLKLAAPDLRVRYYVIGGPVFETQGSQFTREELEASAAARNLAADVVFVPHQSEPENVYRSMDVVVHCSTEPEPFGRVIAEAMACGRAVVASLDGGVPELFEPGSDALGAVPNDVDDFVRKIEGLLRNLDKRAALQTRARSAAVKRFSRARLGLEMRSIFVELMEKNLLRRSAF